jgi:Tol biopolymer transport system component
MIMNPRRVIITVLALALVAAASAYAQGIAEELYQAGLYQEEVQGNLESAIDIYRQILENFPDNRAVGARAQLHVGLCYEKLGLREAQQAYRSVIADFPEHTDEVAVARARLAGLERALADLERQPSFRKIEIASKPQNGVLSPDGKRLAFVSEGAVWVVPLQGNVGPDIAGEPVRLAEVRGVWDNGSLMAWSADGEWIAVNGGSEDGALDAVTVIPVGGGEPRVLRVPDRGRNAGSYRLSLSPGGWTLAISAIELGTEVEAMDVANRRIYTIPTAGGELRQVWSGPARQPSFAPDGRHIAFVGYRERDDWEENTQRPPPDGDLLVAPSSGGNPVKLASLDGGRLIGPVWSPDGKYIAAFYGQGYHSESGEIWVYRVPPDASSAGEPTKIPLPRSSWHMLAGWTPDNELGVFIPSEEHHALYTVPAGGGRALQVTPAVAWPNDPRWSPDGERIYFAGRDEGRDRNATYYVPADGGDPVMVPVPEQWQTTGSVDLSPDGRTIVMSVSPGDFAEGFDLWTIPLEDGCPTRVTSDGAPKDYPSWSPDGRWVAYVGYGRQEESEDEDYVAVYVVPAEGGESRQVTARVDGVRARGVAFTPDAERIAFFSGDAIKTIPLEGGESETLAVGIESGGDSKLAYSPDGSKIAHNAGGKIWITPLATKVPEELRTRLPEDAGIGSFGWSPDGSKIVFTASMGGEQEFWLISDFLPEER